MKKQKVTERKRRRGSKADPRHEYCALMLFMDFLMVEWRNLGRIQIESCRKTVKLVRIGHIEIPSFPEQLYKCNFLAFMFICRSVGYIPGRYVSSHNHTTMDNQRMS